MDRKSLRWFQRTWVWLLVAFVPLALFLLSVEYLHFPTAIALPLSLLALVGPPGGVWMAALVARRGWVQFVLTLLTALVLLLPAWAVWTFSQSLEDDAFLGCTVVETDSGDIVMRDPDLCASLEDGSLQALQRNVWLVSGTGVLTPLVVLYLFRNRLRPAEESKREHEDAGPNSQTVADPSTPYSGFDEDAPATEPD